MIKLLISLVMIFLLVGTAIIYTLTEDKVVNEATDVLYQGPVPQGYDLEYFSLTGETRRIKE